MTSVLINREFNNDYGKMVVVEPELENQAESDCFWEPGNYKRTTKRISDAHFLCNELLQLIQERGEIEAKYASMLRSWSKKWNAAIDKGPEYGSVAAGWKSMLNEADRLAVLHVQMRDKLETDVMGNVRQWQKENFHKTIIREFKEKKELDDAFRKAQKPWEKKLREVEKAKTDYHVSCQKERTAAIRDKNSIKDTSLSVDQKRKIEEDVTRLSDQKSQMRDKYEKSLRDVNEYNAKYMEDMGDVYDKCTEIERHRLVFFKKQLKNIHRVLDISRQDTLSDIYKEYANTIDAADPEKDLRWWSKTYGIDMTMNWPSFEEYQPEIKNISSKKAAKALANGDGIALTGVQYKITEDDVIPIPVPPTSRSPPANTAASHTSGAASSSGGSAPLPSPFPEDEWEDDINSSVGDACDSGVPVRAMYDYKALEDDELSFRKGDVFEKLEDEDDQGWCKGRKDGRLGLFPASYVKDLSVQ